LLEAERLAQSLKPGRPSRLLDDRFDLDTSRNKSSSSGGGTGVGVKQKESGPMVLNITKELTREIFEEFPVVQDAYARHVPGVCLLLFALHDVFHLSKDPSSHASEK
jgi:transcription initiation factor TFIIH subunit 1